MPKRQWQSFFDDISELLRSEIVRVDPAGLGLKDDVPAGWAQLRRLAYDARTDVLEISVHDADRAIEHPAHIFLSCDEGSVQSLEIVTGGDDRHFIIFRDSLRLQAPR